jgi:hypothetical protein
VPLPRQTRFGEFGHSEFAVGRGLSDDDHDRLRGTNVGRMMETLRLGGLTISTDHVKELARPYLNQPGNWSYPAYDSYTGCGDRNTVGPQTPWPQGC